MALVIDPSSPATATQNNGATATVTSGSFTPPLNSILLILWDANSTSGTPPTTPTITDSLGSPLTYNLLDWQSHADSPSADGQTASWWATVTTSSSMTVTVTNGDGAHGNNQAALRVVVLTGQHPTSPIGAHGKSGSGSASTISQNYTASASGGWGFLAATDWSALGNFAVGSGTTSIDTGTIPTNQVSWGYARRTSADDIVNNTNTINYNPAGTSTSLTWVWVEVLPALGGDPSPQWYPGFMTDAGFPTFLSSRSTPGPDFDALSYDTGSTIVDQTATPTGITTNETFGIAAITPGAVTITPTGVPTNETFGTSIASLNLTPTGIPTGETLGSPTIAQGLSPTGFPSNEQFGLSTVTPGAVTITPTGIGSAETFGNSTISLTVSPTGIPSAEALGSPTILLVTSITPTGIPTAERFGNATISPGPATVSPIGILPEEKFGNPLVLPGAVSVAPIGVGSAEAFGSPSILLVTSITPTGIKSEEKFGSQSISITVLPTGIPPTESFGNLAVSVGPVTVSPIGIRTNESFGLANISTGALAQAITPTGMRSREEFGLFGVSRTPDVSATWRLPTINTDTIDEGTQPGDAAGKQTGGAGKPDTIWSSVESHAVR